MKLRADTLFIRLAAMTILLIVLVQVVAVLIVDHTRGDIDTRHAQREILLALQAHRAPSVAASEVAATLGATFVPASEAIAQGCPAPCTNTHGPYETHLREKLPPGSQVVIDEDNGALWVRDAPGKTWVRLDQAVLTPTRFRTLDALRLAIAIVFALAGAWLLQRPLRVLAEASREFRIGRKPPVVKVAGPWEVRELVHDFNQMTHDLARTEQERAVMLAGVAHDLRAPITRMQVRADLLPDEANRTAFLRDAESLSRIVTQFLDFARDSAETGSPHAGVDAYCRRHYGESSEGEDALIQLDLRAGEGFTMPLVDLDRVLTNLIENALTYGDPPVVIATFVRNRHYVLSVRDHGGGIPADQLERALQPFVRLDEARQGDAHCGLGLAIVRRLARYNGGAFDAFNAPDGGLCVEICVPVEMPR